LQKDHSYTENFTVGVSRLDEVGVSMHDMVDVNTQDGSGRDVGGHDGVGQYLHFFLSLLLTTGRWLTAGLWIAEEGHDQHPATNYHQYQLRLNTQSFIKFFHSCLFKMKLAISLNISLLVANQSNC
jgi:hypothetical protein